VRQGELQVVSQTCMGDLHLPARHASSFARGSQGLANVALNWEALVKDGVVVLAALATASW
jgi:hypothetical protein